MKDQKRIIAIEIELGFLNVPTKLRKFFPKEKGKIDFIINNFKKKLLYNPIHGRITGLTEFYRKTKAAPTDIIEFEIVENEISLNLKKLSKNEKKNISITEEEAKKIIDASKLSPSVKGNIVEQRIAELILLHGQGQLNVYKPISDIEGIDLIVVKNGIFQPIFIQVKGRYNLRNNNQIQIGVRERNFIAHHSFFIIAAYFNPKKVDLDDYLVFISSENFKKRANIINRDSDKTKYILTCPLNQEYNGRFSDYIIKKENLVNKIFEKFTEMKKYYN